MVRHYFDVVAILFLLMSGQVVGKARRRNIKQVMDSRIFDFSVMSPSRWEERYVVDGILTLVQ